MCAAGRTSSHDSWKHLPHRYGAPRGAGDFGLAGKLRGLAPTPPRAPRTCHLAMRVRLEALLEEKAKKQRTTPSGVGWGGQRGSWEREARKWGHL